MLLVGVMRSSVTVLRATVNVLLFFVSALYNAVVACDAMKYTVPAPTSVITPLLLIVATLGLLDS